MSDIPGTGRRPTAPSAGPAAHEEYSFVCLRCGHGWEQAYDIEHRTDAQGATRVVWVTGGREVPSPLSSPRCEHCDGHDLRIMRPGRVASVREAFGQVGRAEPPVLAARADEGTARRSARHSWHVSNLVRLLHLRSRVRT
jgi:hypothetical protein